MGEVKTKRRVASWDAAIEAAATKAEKPSPFKLSDTFPEWMKNRDLLPRTPPGGKRRTW